MQIIRASEIGTYIYCHRAWWYQKTGHISENQDGFVTGKELHAQHNRQVFYAGILRTSAYLLLILALLIITAYLTYKLI